MSVSNFEDLDKYIELAICSFKDDFKKVRSDISFEFETESERQDFIAACDNRIHRATTLLNEAAIMLGFVITSVSVIASFSLNRIPEGGLVRPLLQEGDILFRVFVGALIVVLILLIFLLGHYRTCTHAWTAFKEGAILERKGEEQAKNQWNKL